MAKKLAFDKGLFAVVVTLLGLGLGMVYSASAAAARESGGELNPFLLRQMLAACAGLAAMAALMHVDYRHLRRRWVISGLMISTVGLLVAALFSPELNRTHRWVFLGDLSFQPSELAKFALVVFIAYQIDRRQGAEPGWDLLIRCLLMTIPLATLVLLEPDLGTAFLIGAVTLFMLFLAGLRWHFLIFGLPVAAVGLLAAILIEPYRLERLRAFLEPEQDPQGIGFQVLQSLIAIGSGGVVGLGPGQSVQKLHFLPQPQSDFIFAILAEEMGLIGSLALLALFGVLMWRGVAAGVRAPDTFGRFLAWGLSGSLVAQALVNISVAVSLLPTTGVPLPFISYGGSSLLVSLAACGVLLNVSQHG